MTYKCGCNWEGSTKRELVAHSLTWHNSEFLEGDPELVALSKEMSKNTKLLEFREFLKGGA